jgi:hypothetical protein
MPGSLGRPTKAAQNAGRKGSEDEVLRSALTVATLKLLADETRKVITSLERAGS